MEKYDETHCFSVNITSLNLLIPHFCNVTINIFSRVFRNFVSF